MISYVRMRRVARWGALTGIIAVAATARLWHLNAGIPHAVGIDEPQVVGRALRILQTGDWNTHLFDYPSLVIYFHAVVAIGRFMVGAIAGEWTSLSGFNIAAVYTTGRAAAVAIGVATVWLTYDLGAELESPAVGLLGAALLAVSPLHARESRYILTDVPMTALVTLGVWLSVRAARLGTARAYAWAGAIAGLAAAAKYNGGITFVAVLTAWVINERSSPDGRKKIAAAAGAAALGFVAGAPFTILDLPGFLNGFAAQFARFAVPHTGVSPATVYLKHLWLAGSAALVMAMAGIVVVLARRTARVTWAPLLAFVGVYYYELSMHPHVFGRYALPLVPMVSLLAAAATAQLARALQHPALARVPARRWVLAVVVLILLYGPAAETVGWIGTQRRSDTRALAADWLKANAPHGARIAVENSGPTYLDSDGFTVVAVLVLVDHDVAWYRARADYLILSSGDAPRDQAFVDAGPTVFQISPTSQRWGPPIRIVKIW
jgi:4-amino-4-deoxy-L-arabinose transferase-like glycosyltransferase